MPPLAVVKQIWDRGEGVLFKILAVNPDQEDGAYVIFQWIESGKGSQGKRQWLVDYCTLVTNADGTPA